MRKRIHILTIFWLWICCLSIQGQVVRISLFNETPLKCVVVSSLKGNYRVLGEGSLILNLSSNDVTYITLFGQRLLLRNARGAIGNYSSITFESVDTNGILRINPINPSGDSRQYNDNLVVSVAFGRISLINEIQTDNYVAGVVEAEAGSNADIEFYKAQSILARTYLYGHLNRHETEGFHLCDGVHCQAYKGRSTRNPAIVEATRLTSGLVVLASDSSFITAVFHANCGGETETASNAWLNGKNYLISTKDPFCQNSSSAKWNKIITLDQWKMYLKDHGFRFSAKVSPGYFDYMQINRRQFYTIGNDSLPTKQIRTDFQLRSSFFSVVATTGDITFQGRGFGHGVGLCQDGAMQMAKIGYKYDDILKFYYKNISIVKYRADSLKVAVK